MKTHKFARKPFYVDAVRVSEANMEEVAAWCEGEILETSDGRYISVQVYRPINERQTQAFIGDWVLFSGNGFKVYTPKAFDKSFEKVKTLTKAQADEAGIKVPHEPRMPKKPVQPGQEPKKGGVTDREPENDDNKKAPVPRPPLKTPEADETTQFSRKQIADIGKAAIEQGLPETKDEADKLIEEVLAEDQQGPDQA